VAPSVRVVCRVRVVIEIICESRCSCFAMFCYFVCVCVCVSEE
jgi:hypothetical protein